MLSGCWGMSEHFGQLLSEVALAVEFKEEVSWQKEKIEGVVQFPPINNPVFMVTFSQEQVIAALGRFSYLSMEAVINEAPTHP